MPTTCGYPNCKFRSRYRGADDNRHFYRVPKKPAILRNKWLDAIGRTEQTIVSQLRVCSGHFHSGEKKEGDVPVSDPEKDPAVKVELPPKVPRSSAARHNKRVKNLLYQTSKAALAGNLNVESESPQTAKRRKSTSEESTGSSPSLSCLSFMRDLQPPALSVPTPHPLTFINSRGSSTIAARPLVALLDSRDCSIELPILKDLALVAFCDARKSDELHEKVFREASAVLLWNELKLKKEDLQKFSNLKVIVKLGAGHDNIDLDAATEMGVAVSIISSSCVEEMADSNLCLILGLYRRLLPLSISTSRGRQPSPSYPDDDASCGEKNCPPTGQSCPRIRGQVLGLIGFDQVGVAVAIRAKVFGFTVLVYDPNLSQGTDFSLGVNRAFTLHELLERSDCLSIHGFAGKDSNNVVINHDSLMYIKSGAFLVNIASPKAIDEEDLATALTTGKLAAAALDCYDEDHINYSQSPLKHCPNLVCTPRASSFSIQCVSELRERSAQETRKALLGTLPSCLPNCINKDQLINKKQKAFDISENGSINKSNLCYFGLNALAKALFVDH